MLAEHGIVKEPKQRGDAGGGLPKHKIGDYKKDTVFVT